MHFGCRVSLARCPTLGCPSVAHEQIVSLPPALLWESRAASNRRVALKRLARAACLAIGCGFAIAGAWHVPAVQRRVSDAQRGRAQADLSVVAAAVGLYRHDTGKSPEVLADLHDRPGGVEGWRGPYVDCETSLLDPWGNSYIYWHRWGRVHELLSYGADGVPGGHGSGRDLRHWP